MLSLTGRSNRKSQFVTLPSVVQKSRSDIIFLSCHSTRQMSRQLFNIDNKNIAMVINKTDDCTEKVVRYISNKINMPFNWK